MVPNQEALRQVNITPKAGKVSNRVVAGFPFPQDWKGAAFCAQSAGDYFSFLIFFQ